MRDVLMKKIICSIFILLAVGNICYSNAIVQSRIIDDSSKIHSSNYKSNIINNFSINEMYDVPIDELKGKIAKYPNDYELYASLVGLYFRTNQFKEAYPELVFLNNLARNNKLGENTLKVLKDTKKSAINNANYVKDKSYLYLDFALLNLILKDTVQAEKNILSASRVIKDQKLFVETADMVFGSTKNYEGAVNSIDNILYSTANNAELRKLKATYLKQLNRKDEALREYLQILAANKNDADALYYAYDLLSYKNLSEKDLFKNLFGDNTENYESQYGKLVQTLLDHDDISEAKFQAQKLVKKYPDNVDGYIVLSDIYRREGKLQESYDALKIVRDKADSKESISKYNVLLAKLSDEPVSEADGLMNNGLYEQALNVLQDANQDNLYVILSMARANYFLDKKQTALELLNKAMSFYPNNSDVFYYFSFYFYQERDMKNARKYALESLKIDENNRFSKNMIDLINKFESDKYLDQITSSVELQNFAEALRLTNEALKINQKDTNLYYNKGLIYVLMNNYAAATAPLYKAIELDRRNALAYYYLAVAFDNLAENGNALMYYKQFLSLIPVDNYGESEKIQNAKNRIQKLSSGK